MSNDNPNDEAKTSKSAEGSDSEASLQEELQKESAEGKDSIGDAGTNRNLSGASTWNTIDETDADAEPKK